MHRLQLNKEIDLLQMPDRHRINRGGGRVLSIISRRGFPASCLCFLQQGELPDFSVGDWAWFEAKFGPLPQSEPYFQQRWVLCKTGNDGAEHLARSNRHPGLITAGVMAGCNHHHRSASDAWFCPDSASRSRHRAGTLSRNSPKAPDRPRERTDWHLELLACVGGVWRMIDEVENHGIVLY